MLSLVDILIPPVQRVPRMARRPSLSNRPALWVRWDWRPPSQVFQVLEGWAHHRDVPSKGIWATSHHSGALALAKQRPFLDFASLQKKMQRVLPFQNALWRTQNLLEQRWRMSLLLLVASFQISYLGYSNPSSHGCKNTHLKKTTTTPHFRQTSHCFGNPPKGQEEKLFY